MFDVLYVGQLIHELKPVQAQFQQLQKKRDFLLKMLAFHCELLTFKSDEALTEEQVAVLLQFVKLFEENHPAISNVPVATVTGTQDTTTNPINPISNNGATVSDRETDIGLHPLSEEDSTISPGETDMASVNSISSNGATVSERGTNRASVNPISIFITRSRCHNFGGVRDDG